MQSKELREDLQSLKKKRNRRNLKQRKLKKKNRRRVMNNYYCNKFHPMSHPISLSFWDSYARAFQWQKSFLYYHWRNQAKLLYKENQLLKQRLNTPKINVENELKCLPKESSEMMLEAGNSIDDELSEEEDFEIEVSEEFQKFMEISMKHKAERILNKDNCSGVPTNKSHLPSSAYGDCTGPPDEQVGLRRLEDMKLLYGQDSPKIIGMETAVQLNFIRKNDKRKPIFWPVVPLSQISN